MSFPLSVPPSLPLSVSPSLPLSVPPSLRPSLSPSLPLFLRRLFHRHAFAVEADGCGLQHFLALFVLHEGDDGEVVGVDLVLLLGEGERLVAVFTPRGLEVLGVFLQIGADGGDVKAG